jgi:hypothetical protein
MRWQCRYSSAEMLHLEVGAADVRCYLDHSPAKADRWTFADVLTGRYDAACHPTNSRIGSPLSTR